MKFNGIFKGFVLITALSGNFAQAEMAKANGSGSAESSVKANAPKRAATSGISPMFVLKNKENFSLCGDVVDGICLMTYGDAEEYCNLQGQHLPTPEEWEKYRKSRGYKRENGRLTSAMALSSETFRTYDEGYYTAVTVYNGETGKMAESSIIESFGNYGVPNFRLFGVRCAK